MTNNKTKLKYHLENRSATWLELFFDLIFVVLISKITHLLAHSHHGHLQDGIWWKFPLMLLPVWWIWMTHTVWSNFFDEDSVVHRITTLFTMLLMILLSTIMSLDWDTGYKPFIATYLSIWIILGFTFIFNSKKQEKYKHFGKARGSIMIIAALISLSSIFFQPPLRYAVFYLGLIIDIISPFIVTKLKLFKIPEIHKHHLIERMGLLIIILLGESIISLSAGLKEIHWDKNSIIAAISGAIMIMSIWWIYFNSYHKLADNKGKSITGLPLAYPHFLTCLGLAILANLIHHAIHPGLIRLEYQIMASVGMLVFYLGKQTPYFAKYNMFRKNIITNSIITFICSAISISLPNNSLILGGLTTSLMIYITLNYITINRKI